MHLIKPAIPLRKIFLFSYAVILQIGIIQPLRQIYFMVPWSSIYLSYNFCRVNGQIACLSSYYLNIIFAIYVTQQPLFPMCTLVLVAKHTHRFVFELLQFLFACFSVCASDIMVRLSVSMIHRTAYFVFMPFGYTVQVFGFRFDHCVDYFTDFVCSCYDCPHWPFSTLHSAIIIT